MPTTLDARLDDLIALIDGWIRPYVERADSPAARFYQMMAYHLGWVAADGTPLHVFATPLEIDFTNVTATFVGGLRGDCVLSTSGGRVKAYVEPSAGFRLDASTSGGGVNADGLTITIDKGGAGKSRLSGAVNGGGPLLKLRSSGGDIVVSQR